MREFREKIHRSYPTSFDWAKKSLGRPNNDGLPSACHCGALLANKGWRYIPVTREYKCNQCDTVVVCEYHGKS